MSSLQTRRDFLKTSSMAIGSAAIFGGSVLLTGCSEPAPAPTATPEPIETELVIPDHPYQYVELDPIAAEEAGYKAFYDGGCCYGCASSLLGQLSEKVGFPYNAIPPKMFVNGKGGYGAGTLCGSLGGAVAVIGLCCNPEDAAKLTKEIFTWYTSTKLPIYQPEYTCDVASAAKSVNCADSVSDYMALANIEEMSDPARMARCAGVTADVARRTAEILNIHFGFAKAEPTPEVKEPELAANEFIGEADGFGGPVKVKITMDKGEISKIDILSHSETAGISDAAFAEIPNAIIKAQSSTVDATAGSTVSSKAIMAAVEDAISKARA